MGARQAHKNDWHGKAKSLLQARASRSELSENKINRLNVLGIPRPGLEVEMISRAGSPGKLQCWNGL